MTGRRRLQELRRAACLFPVWVEGYRPSAPPPSPRKSGHWDPKRSQSRARGTPYVRHMVNDQNITIAVKTLRRIST